MSAKSCLTGEEAGIWCAVVVSFVPAVTLAVTVSRNCDTLLAAVLCAAALHVVCTAVPYWFLRNAVRREYQLSPHNDEDARDVDADVDSDGSHGTTSSTGSSTDEDALGGSVLQHCGLVRIIQ